ncbi:Fic family protein [Candidatus Thiothrix sp. Deng01]|uniref:Fic family protein n=1 Tax=Candidatus Thiothrix phosphatis TaxID=3112415 RepID=A0ABU6CSG8_9GAMM|nr:Fic family protein [Candidatus Thiothrix sp. Deng01]MEB4589472.1 Fic family protein [Candidatus Thiothrix sp. Deng01]
MKWIHQQPGWPQFHWDAAALGNALAQVRYQQGHLLGRMQALGFELRQEASLNTLTNDVVTSSAIEGDTLDREEVRSSIARKLGLEIGGALPASRHVEGIVEVMLDATQSCQQPLSEERLCAWHCALFPTGFSGMYPIVVGAWRPLSAGPMQVVSGAYGRERVHFEAPEANRLPAEMAAFLQWFGEDDGIDPVLKAGLAHFWFVTLHPFEDGNGRIARAIADMALTRADASPQRFYSMSAQIEAERKAYYNQLERQQRGSLDVTPWLGWFLECLGRALGSAETALESVLHKARVWGCANRYRINERQRLVLNRMLDDFQGYMNNAKYATIAKCSGDTALRDIRSLLEWGLFIQNAGGGRSTSYRLAMAKELGEETR